MEAPMSTITKTTLRSLAGAAALAATLSAVQPAVAETTAGDPAGLDGAQVHQAPVVPQYAAGGGGGAGRRG
jgi:hypothetical protein